MTAAQHLVLASASLVLLTLIVGLRMLYVRIAEMRQKGIPPQAVATPA